MTGIGDLLLNSIIPRTGVFFNRILRELYEFINVHAYYYRWES